MSTKYERERQAIFSSIILLRCVHRMNEGKPNELAKKLIDATEAKIAVGFPEHNALFSFIETMTDGLIRKLMEEGWEKERAADQATFEFAEALRGELGVRAVVRLAKEKGVLAAPEKETVEGLEELMNTVIGMAGNLGE